MASARRGLVPLLLVAWHCATSAKVMTLSLADDLANSALKEARERDLKPVTITVVDEAGRVIVSKREDACGNTIPDFALAKSRSCVGMGMSTRALRDKYAEKPTQLACMATISPLAPFPGGVLLRGADGSSVIGAIGISGAAADEDEHCAVVAARSHGIVSEPASSQLEGPG